MKKLLPVITVLALLAFVPKAHAAYFFLSAAANGTIAQSPLAATVTACQTQAQVTSNVLPAGGDCAATCSKGAALYNFTYFPPNSKKATQTPVGTYAFQSDCQAGFNAAQSAGFNMGPLPCVFAYKCR